MRDAVARGWIGALELTEAAIDRVETRDGSVNAVVIRDFERARNAARAADAALARGDRLPLLGVPMTVKEAHNVAGLPTTWGFPSFRDWIADTDSIAVQRLKDAGAILIGKTNVATALADWQTENAIYGRTSNPWAHGHSPGGSSGGSAAAVATRMVPLELGTDIGGSIRIPAAFCGVFGHKPSYGLVPLRGCSPPGRQGAPQPLNVIGPLARSARDLSVMLDVLAGPDADEAAGYRLALPAPRHSRLRDFRVVLLDRHPVAAIDAEVAAALEHVGTTLSGLGARVMRGSGRLPDLAAAHPVFLQMLVTALAHDGAPSRLSLDAGEWLGLLDAQYAIRREWATTFRDIDVVLAPVAGVMPFPYYAGAGGADRVLVINGVATPFWDQLFWPGIATLAGLPATVVPLALSRTGLPIGLQVIGPYLGDRTTLAFAQAAEAEFGGYRAPAGA